MPDHAFIFLVLPLRILSKVSEGRENGSGDFWGKWKDSKEVLGKLCKLNSCLESGCRWELYDFGLCERVIDGAIDAVSQLP